MPPIPDLFDDPDVATEAWVEGGFTPNWHPLLVVPEINGHLGQWVLVEGYIRGGDESLDRELFAFLRGVFIARRDVQSFRAKFLEVEHPQHYIPKGATENYLYAGEAGRRQNYARHLYQRNSQYRRQIEKAFDGYVSHVPGIRVELPFIQFGWESYHSLYNDFTGFDLPAPSLIQRLDLASKNREIDFYDSMGKLGTLYREAGGRMERGSAHPLVRPCRSTSALLGRYAPSTGLVHLGEKGTG